jgi:hypothetical protein
MTGLDDSFISSVGADYVIGAVGSMDYDVDDFLEPSILGILSMSMEEQPPTGSPSVAPGQALHPLPANQLVEPPPLLTPLTAEVVMWCLIEDRLRPLSVADHDATLLLINNPLNRETIVERFNTTTTVDTWRVVARGGGWGMRR